jgi:hypothetical protein
VATVVVAHHCHELEVGEVGAQGVEVGEVVEVSEAVGGHEHTSTRLAEDEADFLGAVEVHDGHRDCAEEGDAPERGRGLDPVRELERHQLAGTNAALAEPARDPASEVGDASERARPRPEP